jgi:hypothetical protein
MVKNCKSLLMCLLILAVVAICVTCIGENKTNNKLVKEEQINAVAFEDFAGDEKCISCHKDFYNQHLSTAHHLTALPASEKSILGSFNKKDNSYNYTSDIRLVMEKRDSGFYQVAYFKGEEKKAMRFDIVVGSGKMGQSYLTWRNDRLYQLPITYFTAANQWSNSPGFPAKKVMIDRPVTARCLECHTTFAEGVPATAMEPMAFNHKKIIYGIGCEKCHGPAKKHVAFHSEHPSEKDGKFIVNLAKLSRTQQMDACALCHGGNIQKTKPSYQFIAGNSLSDFFTMDSLNFLAAQNGNIDVHGNQVGLLQATKCFKGSKMLSCITCHDSHSNQRGNLAYFSAKCISCHQTTDQNMKTKSHQAVVSIQQNCIDCHMPVETSKSIAVYLEGQETPKASIIRSHFIGVYKNKK